MFQSLKKVAEKFGLNESIESCDEFKIDEFTAGISSLDDFLSYRYFDEQNHLFFNAGDVVGFFVEISSIVGVNEDLVKNLHHFFNKDLPDDSYIQFLIIASHRVENILNFWEAARNSSLTQKITAKRKDFVKKLANDLESFDGRMARDFKIFISFSRNQHSNKDLSPILGFRQQLTMKLNSLNLSCKNCNSQDLIWLVRSIIQIDTKNEISNTPYDRLNILSKQLLLPCNPLAVNDTEIDHDATGISTRCFHLDEIPSEFWLGQTINLLGDPVANINISGRFLISYTIASNISSSRKQAIIARGNKVITDSEKWYSRNDFNLKREASYWYHVVDKLKNGDKVLTTSWQLIVSSKSENIDRVSSELISLYNIHNFN